MDDQSPMRNRLILAAGVILLLLGVYLTLRERPTMAWQVFLKEHGCVQSGYRPPIPGERGYSEYHCADGTDPGKLYDMPGDVR